MKLIPEPQEIMFSGKDKYNLPDHAILYMPDADYRLANAASLIFRHIQELTVSSSNTYALVCQLPFPKSPDSIHSEMADAYELHIIANSLSISSFTAIGLFYGIQTLCQIIENTGRELPCLFIRDWAVTRIRCDHFDLRTIYPTFSNMLRYVKDMAHYKINTLLIEYEDKFPFVTIKELRHPKSLTVDEHQQLLTAAYENYIDIIPLQQTYGHLEYVLKHPSYINLREQENSVAELCPLNPRAKELICHLLEDIISLHPNSYYVHLGGDEVWSIGTCEKCRASGLSNALLFIRFMNQLADFAIEHGKQPIIWHDMLKDATDSELEELDKRIIIAVWIYSGRHMESRSTSMVNRLKQAGFQVFGGPSVRCWDETATQNYPVAERRLENIDAWINTALETQINGIIYTNWSASLALGNPYGLFESTRYLTFFANELAWNPRAQRTDYPNRFFYLYHGIRNTTFLEDDYILTDYYVIPDLYFPLSMKNKATAQLLHIIRQYEVPLKSGLPLQDLLFRGKLFPNNEEITTFLKEKYKENYTILRQVRLDMRILFEELLPSHLVDVYLCSRFFLPDIYEDIAIKLLNIEY